MAGCNQPDESESVSASRDDVPLRLLWVGNEDDAKTVKRKWNAVSTQGIDVTVIGLSRTASADIVPELLQQYKKHDLIVFPLLAAAALVGKNAITPQSDAILGGSSGPQDREDRWTEQNDPQSGDQPRSLSRLYPVLRNGAARFAGQTIGAPLGVSLPAILSEEPIDAMDSWSDYDRWVDQELKGAAAEPTADGWAGQMFLWRCASVAPSPWLFGPESMAPLIAQNDYVDVLKQMATTVKRYKGGLQSPQQIWDSIGTGKLRGGIGWQLPTESDRTEVVFTNLPAQDQSDRVLLDPYALTISISAGCRQTAASASFIQWISAGEGGDSLKGQVADITATRVNSQDDTRSAESSSPYETWLRRRLSKPLTLPTLQLLSGSEYYMALDQQVTNCLAGDVSAKDALAAVASTWSKLNDQVGIKDQERAWRRAQGSRA